MLRSTCTAIGLLLMLSPAMADFRDDIGKIPPAYVEKFNAKDPAGIASMFTKDGLHINQSRETDVKTYYESAFKAGFDHLEVKTNRIELLTDDTAIATGDFTITGKDDKGAPMKASGQWADTLIKQNGQWKIRMLAGFPNAAPKVEASAEKK